MIIKERNIMKIFGKTVTLPDVTFITFVVLVTAGITALSLFYINGYVLHKKSETKISKIIKADTVLTDSIVTHYCKLTVYNPGSKEQKTTYRTAWGDSINPADPKRWACTGIYIEDSLNLKHGDTFFIECQKCPYINGEWLFMDHSYNKGVVELLISNPHEVKLWFKHPAIIYKKYDKKPRTN